jgi:hypothetical protein
MGDWRSEGERWRQGGHGNKEGGCKEGDMSNFPIFFQVMPGILLIMMIPF